MRGGEGQFGTTNHELAAAVEAKPAAPEKAGFQNDLGDIVGRPP